jgi:AraC family transcriptional regulator of adaptative response / DNA-3-methyladenine glycosylase II
MNLDSEICYQAILSRDRRFDGWFYVGVTSTGVYCRPICGVRPPKLLNCRFFRSAASAEKNGFRPCLRCRPELAPGDAMLEVSSSLAKAAAELIEAGFLNEKSVPDLAQRIGVSDRHLRRIFESEFGVTPLQFAQTQRLLLAKRLLTDTNLSVTGIALSAGFGSARSLNEQFKQSYGFAPTRIRKTAPSKEMHSLEFDMGYRPPYAWESMLRFLKDRAIQGFEAFKDDTYTRVLTIKASDAVRRGWITVSHRPKQHNLHVSVSADLSAVVPQVLAGVRRFFDLEARPDVIDAHLGELSQKTPGMRVPGAFDGFEIAVRAVVGQAISLAAARAILARICEASGSQTPGPRNECMVSFPTAEEFLQIADTDLLRTGLMERRLRTLQSVARAIVSGALRLESYVSLNETLTTLREISGIGEWTVQYLAMRALGWPNAFPSGDSVLKKMMPSSVGATATWSSDQWSPWQSYAVLHLWDKYQTELSVDA